MPYMTTAQALVRFLDNQYVSFDGKETKFVEGIFTIFGHGIVCGLGEALDSNRGGLTVFQGKNEQGMAHAATAFAKQNNRRKIIACSSSIGPGAANMITAAATATVNQIPLLLFPADAFSTRQPDPVLQQFEQVNSLATTTNDAYKAVCRYWDRIARPEQLMSAMLNAMRVLTDTSSTGAERRLGAIDFIVKSSELDKTRARILYAIENAIDKISKFDYIKRNTFSYRFGQEIKNISLDDVIYITTTNVGHKLQLVKKTGWAEFIGSLKDIPTRYSQLVQISQSCVINPHNVQNIDLKEKKIIFINGDIEYFSVRNTRKVKTLFKM